MGFQTFLQDFFKCEVKKMTSHWAAVVDKKDNIFADDI